MALFRDELQGYKLVQSTKSIYFKYDKARLCEKCNTATTQDADIEFSLFHGQAQAHALSLSDPSQVFDLPYYKEGTERYLDIFRYFAKILSCELANKGIPVPLTVSEFAISNTNNNSIWLRVSPDETYKLYSENKSNPQWAYRGDLLRRVGKSNLRDVGYDGYITIGAVRYEYSVNLNWLEKLALRLLPDYQYRQLMKADELQLIDE